MTRILGISGSLRRDSYNTELLRAAAQELPPGVELELFEGLKAVPAYDADEDVNPDVVTGRHLVDEAAEIPLQLRHAGAELVAAALEIDQVLALGRRREGIRRGVGRVAPRHRDAPHAQPPPKKLPVNLPFW